VNKFEEVGILASTRTGNLWITNQKRYHLLGKNVSVVVEYDSMYGTPTFINYGKILFNAAVNAELRELRNKIFSVLKVGQKYDSNEGDDDKISEKVMSSWQ
jgi:hypothetical protein